MIKDGKAIASMPSKKKKPKKLDLSHLSTLQPSVSPLADKPVEEQPPSVSPLADKPVEEQPETPAPVPVKDPTPIQEEPTTTPETLETVEESPQEVPAPALIKEAPTDNERPYEPKKPQRSFKPSKTLPSTTNGAGEVFKLGDKILPKSPWGTRALAEITAIYEDNQGDAWVQYIPIEEVPDGWSWLGGITRAELLLKA